MFLFNVLNFNYSFLLCILAAKARTSYLRVHFKHCVEIAAAIKGQKLLKAKEYLSDVTKYKAAIPYTKFTGGIGRHAVGKQYNAPGDKCGWPIKATKSFQDLLRNLESNAESKDLKIEDGNCLKRVIVVQLI